jgi:hypothetical protein
MLYRFLKAAPLPAFIYIPGYAVAGYVTVGSGDINGNTAVVCSANSASTTGFVNFTTVSFDPVTGAPSILGAGQPQNRNRDGSAGIILTGTYLQGGASVSSQGVIALGTGGEIPNSTFIGGQSIPSAPSPINSPFVLPSTFNNGNYGITEGEPQITAQQQTFTSMAVGSCLSWSEQGSNLAYSASTAVKYIIEVVLTFTGETPSPQIETLYYNFPYPNNILIQTGWNNVNKTFSSSLNITKYMPTYTQASSISYSYNGRNYTYNGPAYPIITNYGALIMLIDWIDDQNMIIGYAAGGSTSIFTGPTPLIYDIWNVTNGSTTTPVYSNVSGLISTFGNSINPAAVGYAGKMRWLQIDSNRYIISCCYPNGASPQKTVCVSSLVEYNGAGSFTTLDTVSITMTSLIVNNIPFICYLGSNLVAILTQGIASSQNIFDISNNKFEAQTIFTKPVLWAGGHVPSGSLITYEVSDKQHTVSPGPAASIGGVDSYAQINQYVASSL